jgi:hypothetical protein
MQDWPRIKDIFEHFVCGLKTSPQGYNAEVVQRLKLLDFTQLHSCSCLYVKRQNNHVIIIFDSVDDFIVTGDCKLELELFVRQFRNLVTTTPAVWNSDRVLGMVLVRNRSRRTLEINMTHKIEEVCRDNYIDHTTKKSMSQCRRQDMCWMYSR